MSRLWRRRLSSNKEAPKIYFASPSYRSNQNQETSTYLIGDQTQCHCTLKQHQAILHWKDAGVQHPFQLCHQEILSVLSVPVIRRQEATVTVKKRNFTSFC